MFKPVFLHADRPLKKVQILVNDKPMHVVGECSLAAALLEAGVHTFRHTPVSGQPRGPLCMMGVCFECLVEVDGMPNQQACMSEVKAGMKVRLQVGARSVKGAI